jgi:hypothetical protein
MIDAESFVAALAGPGRRTGATVDDLADLWPVLPDRLRWAMSEAGADVDEWEALELVVRIGERLASRAGKQALFDQGAEVTLIYAHSNLRADTRTGLSVDDDLASRLPLLPLAADIAQFMAGGCLRVELVESDQITGLGGCLSETTKGAIILLSAALTEDQLAEMFAHELAHALDPDSRQIDEVRSEAFAEDLAPRLLAELPESRTAAGELVEASLRAIHGFRRAVPTSDSLADLLEWALVEVCPSWIHLELIAAHRAPGPGVNAPTVDFSSPPSSGEGRPGGSHFERGLAVPAPGPGASGGEL